MKETAALGVAMLLLGSAAFADSVELQAAMPPGGTLQIISRGASIRLVEGSGSTVQLSVTSDATIGKDVLVDLVAEASGVKLEIRRAKEGWRTSWREKTSAELRVPRDISVDIQSSGGSLNLALAIEGSARIETSGGSLQMDGVGGMLKLATSGGNVLIGNIGSDAHLASSGGSVKLGIVAGSLDAESSGGSLRFSEIRGSLRLQSSGGGVSGGPVGDSLSIESSGGSVELELAASTRGGEIGCSGGGLTLHISPAAALDLDLRASGGKVSSRLRGVQSDVSDRSRLVGKLNGGGPLLKGRASGGGIVLAPLATE